MLAAAACMVLSGASTRIGNGEASDTLFKIFQDQSASSQVFLAVADAGSEQDVSRAMAGLGTDAKIKGRSKAAAAAWEAFRVEQRCTIQGVERLRNFFLLFGLVGGVQLSWNSSGSG